MTETLTIRPATLEDREAAEILMLACERHYWGARPGDTTLAAEMAEALLSGISGCRLVLAFLPAPVGPAGFATYTLLHPAPTATGTLFLKDLFVRDAARGHGLGERMLRHLAQIAAERNCHRFDWTAEDDNPRALAFYDRLGAERVREKVYYRLTGEAIGRFARG